MYISRPQNPKCLKNVRLNPDLHKSKHAPLLLCHVCLGDRLQLGENGVQMGCGTEPQTNGTALKQQGFLLNKLTGHLNVIRDKSITKRLHLVSNLNELCLTSNL